MKSLTIKSRLLERIINVSFVVMRETGGFIGVKNDVIVKYYFDAGSTHSDNYKYRPNMEIFNRLLNTWHNEGVNQYGILHTHINNNSKLSNEDILFIKNIFLCNETIMSMYFPVVLPSKKMDTYYFWKVENEVRYELIDLKIL